MLRRAAVSAAAAGRALLQTEGAAVVAGLEAQLPRVFGSCLSRRALSKWAPAVLNNGERGQNHYKHFKGRGPVLTQPLWMYVLGATGGVGALVYATNQQQVPYTKRWHTILMSKEREQAIGLMQFRIIQAQFGRRVLPRGSREAMTVEYVGRRIAEVASADLGGGYAEHLRNLTWEFMVVDSPEVNAFVLPGGKVVVFSGLLRAMKSRDELAAVLAHEVAHVVARHHAERLAQANAFNALRLAASLFLGLPVPGGLLELAFVLPHSRAAETEADVIGSRIMAQACFKPEACVSMMNTLSALERASGTDRLPDVLKTHPQSSSRMQRLREEMPAARAVYDSAGCGSTYRAWGSTQRHSNTAF